MDQDALHPQRIRHQAGMLAAGAAEALQGEANRVVTLLQRHPAHGARHVGDRDGDEVFRQFFGRDIATGRGGHVTRQCCELLHHHGAVQRLFAVRSEDGGEILRLQLAQQQVGIGDGQRPAAAIAGRARRGAGAVGPHAQPPGFEMQDGAAAGRQGVDGHHGTAQLHAGDLSVEAALQCAGIQRHIGGGAAHVEADDAIDAQRFCRA